MRNIGIAIMMLVFGASTFAQVNVSGIVKNYSEFTVEGVVVTLGSNPSVTATTNQSGEFEINSTSPIHRDGVYKAAPLNIRSLEIRGSQLHFSTYSEVNQGFISLRDISGTQKFLTSLNNLAAGGHRYALPRMASGIYVLQFSLDSFTTEAKCLATDKGVFLKGRMFSHGNPGVLHRQAAAVDSLIFTHERYTTKTYLIESAEESDIEIKMLPASVLDPITDYSAMGPYNTVTETNTGPDGAYTIIRPANLGQDGFLHSPIMFGPGTGMEVSQMSNLISRIASHGFVVIGRRLDGGPGSAQTRDRLNGGLDWIIEQNSVSGSDYEGKLDVERAVVMGYSVGATGSIEVGGHEALATLVAIHGHEAEGDMHTPVLMIGGTNDITQGESWLAPSYAASQVQTFFGMMQGAGHGYIQESINGVQGGNETPGIIAWIRYWVYGDQGAKHFFYGEDCVMCSSPWAEAQRKNWPED